jgi:RNA-binding protein
MLSGQARRYLRGRAHGLDPAVQVGKAGLTAPVAESIDVSLRAHELIKVRVAADRDERDELAAAIEQRLGCECVGIIGRMVILYRQHEDPDRRRIELP